MRSTPYLPSLPGTLWSGVEAPDRVLLQRQLGPKIKDMSLELIKMYIFIYARVQRKNKHTFPNVKTETKQMHS